MSPLARVTLVTMSRHTLVTRHESLPGLTITLLSTGEKYEVGHRAEQTAVTTTSSETAARSR